MMKVAKKFFVVFLVVCLFLNNFVASGTSFSTASLENSITEFAFDIIFEISQDDSDCPWSIETTVDSSFITYDYQNQINGGIYNLTTNGKDTGYIHVFYGNNEYNLISFAYEGNHYIGNQIGLYQSVRSKLSVSFNTDQIVYAGGIVFYLKNGSQFYDLSQQEIIKNADVAKLQESYHRIENQLYAEAMDLKNNTQIRSASSGIKKYVLNANNADIVTRYDFPYNLSGRPMTNHCAPTAATMMIKYWANRRGVSQLYHQSDLWVFSSLYAHMETDSGGTDPDMIIPGVISYSTSTRGVPVSGWDRYGDSIFEWPDFEQAQAYIDVNVPFIMTMELANNVDHAVFCAGYYTVGGRDQLIFANGETQVWTFQSYSSLDVDELMYARWN